MLEINSSQQKRQFPITVKDVAADREDDNGPASPEKTRTG
jgi:hypothetical protein